MKRKQRDPKHYVFNIVKTKNKMFLRLLGRQKHIAWLKGHWDAKIVYHNFDSMWKYFYNKEEKSSSI